jgi:hypothetical protein
MPQSDQTEISNLKLTCVCFAKAVALGRLVVIVLVTVPKVRGLKPGQ